MQYQTWSTKKFWLIVVAIFFAGAVVEASATTKPTTAAPAPQVVTRTVTDTASAQKLKSLDDQIITAASKALALQTQNSQLYMNGIASGNLATINQATTTISANNSQMETLTQQVTALGQQRQALLAQLKL